MNIVSFGGGTNSAALLIGLYKHKIPIDLITFADTGAEHPHTYQFIEIINQWLAEHGMPQITVVQYVDRYGNRLSLETECLRSHTLPSIAYGHKTSNSLKGFAKRKYDKEHETELREYDSYRAKLKKMLSSDEKITPKKWTAEKAKLEEQLQESNPDYARVVTELASTEVIEHNRKMLAMTREAEQNQRSQIHSRKKNEQSL